MRYKTGFIYIVDEEERSKLIQQSIERDGTFSDALSDADWKPKTNEVFLISLDGQSIQYFAYVERRNRVVSGKFRLVFSDFLALKPAVSIAQILGELPKILQNYFSRSSTGMGKRIPEGTWKEVVETIKKLRPNEADEIEELLNASKFDVVREDNLEINSHKRDAVLMAVQFAGIGIKKTPLSEVDRSKDLFSSKNAKGLLRYDPKEDLLKYEDETADSPFLKGIDTISLREDQMIANDANVFGGLKRLDSNVLITKFGDNEKQLSIFNVNRTLIEEQTGVDLIYYNAFYKSYVLIQYKRMASENQEKACYRFNDESFKKEYDNMSGIHNSLKDIDLKSMGLSDYRLNSGMFYFKFCPVEVIVKEPQMIKGMYTSLDYLTLFLKSDESRGLKGGTYISYDNNPRYLNNTDFTTLVQHGWIGSQLEQTDMITDIINELLRNKHSVVLAHLRPL